MKTVDLWKWRTIWCFELPALFDQVLREAADAHRNRRLLAVANVEHADAWMLTLRQKYEDNTKRLNINFLVVVFSPLHKLWRHVARCANHLRAAPSSQFLLDESWKTEVAHLRVVVFRSGWITPAECTDFKLLAQNSSRIDGLCVETSCTDNARVIKTVDDFVPLKKSLESFRAVHIFIFVFIVAVRWFSFFLINVHLELLQRKSLLAQNIENFWCHSMSILSDFLKWVNRRSINDLDISFSFFHFEDSFCHLTVFFRVSRSLLSFSSSLFCDLTFVFSAAFSPKSSLVSQCHWCHFSLFLILVMLYGSLFLWFVCLVCFLAVLFQQKQLKYLILKCRMKHRLWSLSQLVCKYWSLVRRWGAAHNCYLHTRGPSLLMWWKVNEFAVWWSSFSQSQTAR